MNLFKVRATEQIAPNTILLKLEPKRRRDELQFYPGQYAAIGIKRGYRPSPMRCFSIVSSPNNPKQLQFAMRVYGDFTRSISELTPGDSVFVRGPFGDFVIDEEYDKNVIFMAGGIGITPFMSMIRYASETKSNVPITLLYSCNSQSNIPFFDELNEHQRINPNFKVIYFITGQKGSPVSGATILSERISESRLDQLTNQSYNRFTYFICGPKGFIGGIKTILDKNNTNRSRIISEEFTPTSQLKNILSNDRYSINKWTYGLATASLVMAVGLIMIVDLVKTVPKLASAQSIQQNQTSQNLNQANGSFSSNAGSQQGTSNNTSNSGSTSQFSSNNVVYQSPVTSVS